MAPKNLSISLWEHELFFLSDIANSQPQAAHTVFTHGYVHKFIFLCRTIPNIKGYLHPLENCIRSILIPSLTGRPPPNDLERDLLGLPPRLGGLGIINPTEISTGKFSASKSIALPLSNLIKEQQLEYLTTMHKRLPNKDKEVHHIYKTRGEKRIYCIPWPQPYLPFALTI